jgi:hypothetical protein
VKKVNPDEYVTQFEDLPYIVAVAAETMGIQGKQGAAEMSPGEFLERAESAISRYPVHAHEIGLVTLAILADSYIQENNYRNLLRDQLALMGDFIQEAAWTSKTKRPPRAH